MTARSKGFAPSTLEELREFAAIAIKSGFAPSGVQVETAMMIIAKGMECGLGPLMALQTIGLVRGKPTVYGDAIPGLILASGLLGRMEETIEGEGEATVAICKMWRKGHETPFVATFSIADAKRAQLWGRAGPWTQYPRRMLQVRARGFCSRDGFADVLAGMISVEEAEDYPEDAAKGPTILPTERPAEIAINSSVGGTNGNYRTDDLLG